MIKNKIIKIFLFGILFIFLFGCKQGEITQKRSNLIYQGKAYSSSSTHVFSSFNNLDFDKDEQKIYLHNCKLEYIGLKKLHFIEEKKSILWYALDDYFLISYDNDKNYSFSRIWLYTDNSLTLPDFTAENISEIQTCIGIPRFAGYDEFFEFNHQPQDYKMKDVYTEFLYRYESTSDAAFIKRFVNEVKESGSIKAMADEVMRSNEDAVKKAQEEYRSQCIDNEKVLVYYKVCFKNEDFPFRLIFTF